MAGSIGETVRNLITSPILWLGLILAVATGGCAENQLRSAAGREPFSAASIARGAADFANGPCIGCHTIDGISTANKGINLTHEGSRHPPDWLRDELINPTSPRPPIPADQIDDLAAYLTSLK